MLGHGHSYSVERIQALMVRAPRSNQLNMSRSLMILAHPGNLCSMQFWEMPHALMRWAYIWEHLTILYLDDQKALAISVFSY